MKRIAILAAAALVAGVAHADPVTVYTPKDGASAQDVSAYVEKLELAVKKVCQSAYAPITGLGFYGYLACVKATRAEVQRQDPTGLYAKRESAPVQVAAK